MARMPRKMSEPHMVAMVVDSHGDGLPHTMQGSLGVFGSILGFLGSTTLA